MSGRSERTAAPERSSDPELDSPLSRALAAAQVGTWSYDELRHEYWDATTKSLFGIPARDEPTTELFLGCVHPDDRKQYAQAFAAAVDPAGSGHYACDFRIYRADTGAERWLSSRGHSEFAGGTFVRMIGVVQDVTERKRAEEQLRQSEERFRGIFENAATGIALVEMQGKFQQCNPAYLEMLGYTQDELRTMHFKEIIYPDDRAPTLAKIEELLRGDIPFFAITGRYLRKDGGVRWMQRFVSLLRNADGEPISIMALATDMTDRVNYEHKIELLLREVNHRAKNMLGVVQAIARSSAASNPEEFQTRFAARIRALATAHDLLVASDWQGVELSDLVEAQFAQLPESIAGRTTVSGPPLRISGAAAQTLGMALHELAINALTYGALSSPNGRITIQWESNGQDFTIAWEEHSGPPVKAGKSTGFGTVVLDRMARMALGGEVQLEFASEGFYWRLRCPLGKIEAKPVELE